MTKNPEDTYARPVLVELEQEYQKEMVKQMSPPNMTSAIGGSTLNNVHAIELDSGMSLVTRIGTDDTPAVAFPAHFFWTFQELLAECLYPNPKDRKQKKG